MLSKEEVSGVGNQNQSVAELETTCPNSPGCDSVRACFECGGVRSRKVD